MRSPLSSLASLIALSALAVLAPRTATAKYQVCSITINSNDEIEAFKMALPAADFEFRELSPLASEPAGEAGPDTQAGTGDARRVNSHFLKPYCLQHQRCDVLLISGHFGGTFTGTANFSLSLDDMNSLSCSSACDGLFGAPKEVFLFGCNTLAGKTQDSRTPREYVQVLIEHGYPENEARQISNLRYGPTGGTFIEAMQRVFNRTPKIYGFDSISPRGSTDAQFLRSYFKAVGDYKVHLDQLKMDSAANAALKQAFRYTSFIESSGRDSEERGLMCEILDPSLPVVKKALLFEKAIAGPSPLSFIPSIQKAIRDSRELSDYFSKKRANQKISEVFDSIRNNEAVKNLVGRALESLQVMLPTNAFDLMDFSQQMGWFTKQQVTDRKSAFYRQLLQDPKPESLTTLCELRDYSVALEASDARLIAGQAQELRKVSCLPLIETPGFFAAMTERMFVLIRQKARPSATAYQGWVFQNLMQNAALGKTFVRLYLGTDDEVFFNPLVIQQGLETNAFFYQGPAVLKSMEARIAKHPEFKKYREQFSSLRD